MGLRCIIGHDYGGPERSETREERGKEQVVTVREYRECTRCGHQQVISENTEVRSTEEPEPEEPSDAENREPVKEPRAPESGRSEPDRTGSESEYEDVSAEEDDGVILDDDEPERDPGEWPESDQETEEPADHEDWPDDHREKTSEDADHEDWPTPEGDDEGFDAEPSSGGPDESVDFGGGLNPDRSGEPIEEGGETIEGAGGSGGDSAPSDVEGASDAPTGIRRSDPGPSPTTQQRPANPDTEFVCPNCDHTAPAHESSLRPGDICPECSHGYLTEREDAR
jgi:ssDNA-binding Zn-finger/Zn-ribbon topoisomerase 1